jgi:hypothetical protein
MRAVLKRSALYGMIILLFAYILLAWFVNRSGDAIQSEYAEKIWVHRVNSIAKLNEVQSLFHGVELDIVIKDDGFFDVNHPPAESIDLSLREYFDAALRRSQFGFWLDIKNLTPSNSQQALSRLMQLCTEFSISPGQIIVESTNPAVLPLFKKEGFQTSYYLPQHLGDGSAKQQREKLNTLKNTVNQFPSDFLSTNRKDYSIVKSEFPRAQILTWSFQYSSGLILNPFVLAREAMDWSAKNDLLHDDQVKVVLFSYTARQGNR